MLSFAKAGFRIDAINSQCLKDYDHLLVSKQVDSKPNLSNFVFGRLQRSIVGMIWLSGSGIFIKVSLQSDLILKMISRNSFLKCFQLFQTFSVLKK